MPKASQDWQIHQDRINQLQKAEDAKAADHANLMKLILGMLMGGMGAGAKGLANTKQPVAKKSKGKR